MVYNLATSGHGLPSVMLLGKLVIATVHFIHKVQHSEMYESNQQGKMKGGMLFRACFVAEWSED